MIRVSSILVAISMVVIAAALGIALYYLGGLSLRETSVVSLAALVFLTLFNAVSMRLRDRGEVGVQIADLSRGVGDLARQVAEFGRRLAALENRVDAPARAIRDDATAAEVAELGALVKRLAMQIATHDEVIAAGAAASVAPREDVFADDAPAPSLPPLPAAKQAPVAGIASDAQMIATVKGAVEANRIDLYLQPLVTLPQRKVRYYEAVSRLRDTQGEVLTASAFIAPAEMAGLMPRIDYMVLFRCVQVLRRLQARNKDIGLFCNMAGSTLSDGEIFAQCLDFLDANRALAPSLVLEFKQDTIRKLGPAESERLANLVQRGYRLSIDHVADLRFEPKELADRGVRFIKVPASLLLDQGRLASSDIHPADLSDLLGRFGVDLVAEKIEGESSVVDLLDYDVRYGQGFLFSPPRPLRQDDAQGARSEPAAAGA
jgi:cyclic-di-GMP phosphodiesterase, flagellum assembly factor TipF